MKNINIDSTKSIEELENDFWQDHDYPTDLIKKIHLYRKIPLKELSLEQIRVLITQNVGLKFLIPEALEILNTNILTDTGLYEGDLLISVISCDSSYWINNPNYKIHTCEIINRNRNEIESKNENNSLRHVIKRINEFYKSA